jgi:hypothetical protein
MVSPEFAKDLHLDQAHFEKLVGGNPWQAPDTSPAETSK